MCIKTISVYMGLDTRKRVRGCEQQRGQPACASALSDQRLLFISRLAIYLPINLIIYLVIETVLLSTHNKLNGEFHLSRKD